MWVMLIVVAAALLVVFGPGGKILTLISSTLGAIALGWVGWQVLAMSNEEWERLPEQEDSRLRAMH